MIDPDGTLEALNNMGFPSAILPSPPKQKSSPVNDHSSPGQTPTLCQPEVRVLHPAAGAVSAEFENAESEADFSIHFTVYVFIELKKKEMLSFKICSICGI